MNLEPLIQLLARMVAEQLVAETDEQAAGTICGDATINDQEDERNA